MFARMGVQVSGINCDVGSTKVECINLPPKKVYSRDAFEAAIRSSKILNYGLSDEQKTYGSAEIIVTIIDSVHTKIINEFHNDCSFLKGYDDQWNEKLR